MNLNLNELTELMAEAVGAQNFSVAADIKEKIRMLEVSKAALQEEMEPKPVPQQLQSQVCRLTRIAHLLPIV